MRVTLQLASAPLKRSQDGFDSSLRSRLTGPDSSFWILNFIASLQPV